jgi:hypothetical protein
MANVLPFRHVFIDHSNIWGGARAATRIRASHLEERQARLSIKHLDRILTEGDKGVFTKIVSGGVPPGMEGVWTQYEKANYDTQRLFRDKDWKERGVDHSIIGHMWRLLALHPTAPTTLILASGDGKKNEFGTSFYEVLQEILTHKRYGSWRVKLASFDWLPSNVASPTARKMLKVVESSERGEFINLMDHYEKLVYHET